MSNGRQEPDGTLVVRTDEAKKIITDVESSAITYEGRALSSAVPTSASQWQIKRSLNIGNVTTVEFADNGRYSQVWDNRTSLFPAPQLVNTHSLNFDGVNEYVDMGDVHDTSPATAFTWSMWVNPQNVTARRALVSKTTADANVNGLGIYVDPGGDIFVQFRSTSGNGQYLTSDTIDAGTWSHVCVTYSGNSNMNGFRCYLNGILDTPTPSSQNVSGSTETDTSLFFAKRGSSFHFSGNLNQFSLWDRALSESEVAQIYNSGSPPDLTTFLFSNRLVSWWPMGSDSDFPNVPDTQGGFDGIMQNMEAEDYESDVP